jgi:hypothetical protein
MQDWSLKDKVMTRILFFLLIVFLTWAPVIEALARTEP